MGSINSNIPCLSSEIVGETKYLDGITSLIDVCSGTTTINDVDIPRIAGYYLCF